jgi:raffinose/stachyose/melibiose transport system substrate-binding protein
MSRRFNLNYVGLALLTIAFIWSAVRVTVAQRQASGRVVATGQEKVVRITHWQLEPGFREALDAVIAEYNELPKVKAAGVRVQQLAISEKVFQQFLNVHMISGTAPDISARGLSKLVRGSAVGRFLEPITAWVDAPNPYNAPALLPAGLEPEMARDLAAAPWRETFLDGMQAGWDDELQGYYNVPIASPGSIRIFYNRDLMREVKAFAARALATEPRPAWLAAALTPRAQGGEGFTPDDAGLRAWLAGDDPPPSLGRLLLLCEAVRPFAAHQGRRKLIAISGSNYGPGNFSEAYLAPFTAGLGEQLDIEHDSSVSPLESFAGLSEGIWDFDHPGVRAYFDCVRVVARQFPAGFLGLDREQAIRRFLQGHALMVASGGWDASSIFVGSKGKFALGIMAYPPPVAGERWHEEYLDQVNETESPMGVPLAIYKRSPNKEWAVDFLQFLSSARINERFARQAGWLPAAVGARPTERMAPFAPSAAGVKRSMGFNFRGSSHPSITYEGLFWLYMAGDLPYEELAVRLQEALRSPRYGMNRLWFEGARGQQESARAKERALSVEEARELFLGDESAHQRHRAILLTSLMLNDGANLRAAWAARYPGEPFPDF